VGPVGKQHHPFKEKDRVTYYDQNIKGLMDATVIEVKFPPDKKNRGEYVIRYESGFKVDVFGTQINLKT